MKKLMMVSLAVTLSAAPAVASQRTVIALVDVSISVTHRALYTSGLEQLASSLVPGTRFVLAAITATTFTSPDVLFDERYPRCSIVSDSPSKCRRVEADFKLRLREALDAIMKRTGSSHTAIMDGSLLAAKLIERGDESVVVFFTDAIEDSERGNFSKAVPTPEETRNMLELQRRARALPDLHGATVRMVGMSARTTVQALALERFWLSWFRATNACIDRAGGLTPVTTGRIASAASPVCPTN